jgi:hypothetical protein
MKACYLVNKAMTSRFGGASTFEEVRRAEGPASRDKLIEPLAKDANIPKERSWKEEEVMGSLDQDSGVSGTFQQFSHVRPRAGRAVVGRSNCRRLDRRILPRLDGRGVYGHKGRGSCRSCFLQGSGLRRRTSAVVMLGAVMLFFTTHDPDVRPLHQGENRREAERHTSH